MTRAYLQEAALADPVAGLRQGASMIDQITLTGTAEALSYQSWLHSLSDRARRALSPEEAWEAGATTMFQALVERGFVPAHDVERALASTLDVLSR